MIASTGNKLIDAAVNALQDANVAEVGVNLFAHFLPDGISSAIVVVDNNVTDTTIAGIPAYRRSEFRIIARNADYAAGFAISNGAKDALVALQGRTLGGVEFKVIEAMHDPIVLPPSQNNMSKEFVTNFMVCYGLTA